MDETVPHFALGKRANLPSLAASRGKRCARMKGWTAGNHVAPQGDGYSVPFAHWRCIKRFDISRAPALRLNP